MRLLLPMLLLGVVPGLAHAQGRLVDHTEARRYAGEEVTIEGPVAKVTPGSGGSLWLSLGQAHPKSTIVIVVLEEFARTIQDPSSFEGTVIRAYGRISGAGSSGGAQSRGNGSGSGLRGSAPRTPYIVLQDMSRLKIVPGPATPSTGSRTR